MEIYDHFFREERGMPFFGGIESTYAYLRWYDMFLSAAMDTGADSDLLRSKLRIGADILRSRERSTIGKEALAGDGIGLGSIAALYGLYGFGFFCLLMAVAQEMEGRYLSVLKQLPMGKGSSGVPTFNLAEDIYSLILDDEELMEMKRTEFNLHHCPLFTIYPGNQGRGSLMDCFEANRQLVALLKGDYILSRELSEICYEADAFGNEESSIVHEAERKMLTGYLSDFSDVNEGNGGEIIQIAGAEGSGRKQLILHSLKKGRTVVFLSLHKLLLMDADNLQQLSAQLKVRCNVLDEELVIIKQEKDSVNALMTVISNFLRQLRRVFVITDKKCLLNDNAPHLSLFSIRLNVPRALEQQNLWSSELSLIRTNKDVKVTDFSGRYRLQPGAIHACVQMAKKNALSRGRDEVTKDDITDAVLFDTTARLDALSDRIPLTFDWDDLVIEDSQRMIMETLCSRVKNRNLVNEEWGFDEKISYGKGVSMILYGPPGTGKTMAAQVMAKEIGMALYRVDLSQLVDKYIGETEKNIGKIFDAASDGNVILFFDEADALFSRRTEVHSSNDKHANTEVAYLLQKIEQHDGVTFLATNRFNDFDAAFLRRLTYTVRLLKPDAERRLELYQKILPDKTPREKNLDLEFFANTFELSGSEIKEVLYSAAFIAAMDGTELKNIHISRAIKYQQEKTGKLMNGSEFGKYSII